MQGIAVSHVAITMMSAEPVQWQPPPPALPKPPSTATTRRRLCCIIIAAAAATECYGQWNDSATPEETKVCPTKTPNAMLHQVLKSDKFGTDLWKKKTKTKGWFRRLVHGQTLLVHRKLVWRMGCLQGGCSDKNNIES